MQIFLHLRQTTSQGGQAILRVVLRHFWNVLVDRFRRLATVRRLGRLEPRVAEYVAGVEALRRVLPQQAADEAPPANGNAVRNDVASQRYLRKQDRRLRVLERITADEHRVEDDPEAPHVGRLARIAVVRLEDFGADVCRAAVFLGHVIAVRVGQYTGIFKTTDLNIGPEARQMRTLSESLHEIKQNVQDSNITPQK